MDMMRVGPALPGMSPFSKDSDGAVTFNGQQGRRIDWGHCFDADRGYRVFFKFRDSPAINTWDGEDLIRWCDFPPEDDDQKLLIAVSTKLAQQVITMNREWVRIGRPVGGLPMEPKGRA